MTLIAFVRAGVPGSIGPCEGALPMAPIILVCTCIAISIGLCAGALPMAFTILVRASVPALSEVRAPPTLPTRTSGRLYSAPIAMDSAMEFVGV